MAATYQNVVGACCNGSDVLAPCRDGLQGIGNLDLVEIWNAHVNKRELPHGITPGIARRVVHAIAKVPCISLPLAPKYQLLCQ